MFSVWSILRSEISRYASLNFISVSANSFFKCWITSVNFSISVSFSCSSLFMWTSGPSCCRKKKHWEKNIEWLYFIDFHFKILTIKYLLAWAKWRENATTLTSGLKLGSRSLHALYPQALYGWSLIQTRLGCRVGGMNNGQPSCIKLQTDRQTVGEYTSNHKAPAEHNTHLHFLYCIVGLKSNIGVMSMDKNMKWYWIPYFILLNITSGFIQFGSLTCVLTFLSHKFLESPSVVPLHAWLTNITCQIKV